MNRILLSLGLGTACLALAACDGADGGNQAAGNQAGQVEGAGDGKTIAASLDQNSRFMAAAKAAGLDATLNGREPYTVLVPDDAAFGKLPAGTVDDLMKPESRSQLTRVLTYHILPGVVLAEDIGKAIENADGNKAVLATMGGGTVTATKEGDKIVLTDAAGTKATVTASDQQHSNGVVHRIDTVLAPGDQQG